MFDEGELLGVFVPIELIRYLSKPLIEGRVADSLKVLDAFCECWIHACFSAVRESKVISSNGECDKVKFLAGKLRYLPVNVVEDIAGAGREFKARMVVHERVQFEKLCWI